MTEQDHTVKNQASESQTEPLQDTSVQKSEDTGPEKSNVKPFPKPGKMKKIVCPSGLTVTLRKMQTHEYDYFDGATERDVPTITTSILNSCTEQVHSPVPAFYSLSKEGNLDWMKVLTGDRLYALVQLRILSLGSKYEFTVHCERPYCPRMIHWKVDLDEDIPVLDLPDESLEALSANKPLSFKLPDSGNVVKFVLPTAEIEERLMKMEDNQFQTKITAQRLLHRIVDIEGVEPNDRSTFLDKMDIDELAELQIAMDDADCGIDTNIIVQCGGCKASQEVSLPFGLTFWLPSTLERNRRRRRRSRSSKE